MKNYLHSTDIIWYDTSVKTAIEALGDEYPNAIPVFCSALSASKYTLCEHPDFDKFISFLDDVAQGAEFYDWHGGVLDAVRIFCRLCGVDVCLVEIYLGVSLEDVYA